MRTYHALAVWAAEPPAISRQIALDLAALRDG
jgi:hypothetical protein